MRNRAEIKMQAKSIMRGAEVSPYLVTLIVLAIGLVLNEITETVQYGEPFGSVAATQQYLDMIASGELDALTAGIVPETTTGAFFFSILVSLVTIVLNGGYFIYCMGVRQGQRMPYSTLADGLSVAGKLIWCWIQISVRTFLWSLLFVVPGIIATYRYRFAYYNILTDDSLSAGDAIRLSCQQTEGVKGELFVLDLSFIGWYMLVPLTLGILNIWLTPYVTLCDLAYFEDAQLRLGRAPYGGTSGPRAAGEDPWQ